MDLRHHLLYLDSVLDLVSSTDDSADDARFRWNVEAVGCENRIISHAAR